MDWDILANEWNVSQIVEWGLDLPIYDLPIEEKEEKDNNTETCEMCGK